MSTSAYADASVDFKDDEDSSTIVAMVEGGDVSIEVTPAQALEIALRTSSGRCAPQKCDITLEEERSNAAARVVYEVELYAPVKVFSLFRASLPVKVSIDATTGAVVESEGAWRAF